MKTRRALLIYIAMVLPLYFGIGWQLSTHLIAGPGPDPKQWIWFLTWLPHALLHGVNPWHTKSLWYPHGINTAWATGTPLLCVLMAPVTLLAGPFVAYNILAGLTIIANALAARFLALSIGCRSVPAFLVGAGFAFSPFAMAELMGRPNIYTTWPMTLLVAVYVLYAREEISDMAYLLVAALLASAQAYVSIEPAVTLALAGGLLLVTTLVISPGHRRAIIETIPASVGAVALTALICWPLIWAMLSSAHSPGIVFEQKYTAADLLNFVIPTPVTALGGQMWQCVSVSFQCQFQECDGYIGVPLLAAFGYLCSKNRGTVAAKIFAAGLAIAVVFALGTHLEIGGIVTPLLLPTHWLDRIPLLKKIIPCRIVQYSTLAAMLGAAYFWPTTVKRWRTDTFAGSIKRAICPRNLAAGAICLSLVPSLSFNYWSYRPCNPSFFSTQIYKRYLHPGQCVLILPEYAQGNAEMYVGEDHFYWHSAAGWIGAATPHGLYIQRIKKRQILGWLQAHHCRTVIVPVKWCRREQRRGITTQLRPIARVGGVEIFRDTQKWGKP